MKDVTKVYLERAVAHERYTTDILTNLPSLPVETVEETRPLFDALKNTPDPISAGKRILVIERNKGAFLKKCPGTKDYICCGYQILNFSTQCNLECAYCILQAYFNNPALRIFANLDDLFKELREKIDTNPQRRWRIGTGEFTDSLSLETITGFSQYVIPFFIEREHTLLELKTKTTNIDFLRRYDPRGRIMLSWSLNSEHIQQAEEDKTAPIEDRLRAARAAQDAGYRVGFHFDPIVYDTGWESGYRKTIAMMYDILDMDRISWISLGCFRFMPPLKSIVEQRRPGTRLFLGEFIQGGDGKMRYPRPLRIMIYRKMADWLTRGSTDKTAALKKMHVYFCMEHDSVWDASLGFSVKNSAGLIRYLDSSIWP